MYTVVGIDIGLGPFTAYVVTEFVIGLLIIYKY